MVETALILPLFFLLIYAGIDLVRLVALTGQVNQSSAVISGILAREEYIDEVELSDSLKLASQILSLENTENSLALGITAISSHPRLGTVVLWKRSYSDEGGSCNTQNPEFNTSAVEAKESEKIGFLIVVNLCAIPAETFFLSQLYLALDLRLSSQSVSMALHPAVRILD
jgi:TadE-like protein